MGKTMVIESPLEVVEKLNAAFNRKDHLFIARTKRNQGLVVINW